MRGYLTPLRIIVIMLVGLVLAANIAFFTFTQNGLVGNEMFRSGSYIFNPTTLQLSHYRYRGFKEFFDFMRTFPGLNISLSTINEVAAIITGQLNYLPESLIVLDWIVKLVQIVFLPVKLLFTFVIDVFNIIVWLVRWLIPTLYA